MNSLVKSPFPDAINIDYEILSSNTALIEAGKAAGYDFKFTNKTYSKVDSNTIVDSEFDADFSESKKAYYIMAGMSGVLTGTVSTVFAGKTELAYKSEQALKDFVIKIAKTANCKIPQNVTKEAAFSIACDFLMKLIANTAVDPANPATMCNLAGLSLTIVSALTGKKITLNNGIPAMEDIEDSPVSAKAIAERVMFGVLVWFLQILAADARDDEMASIIEKNLPKELARLIHELAHTKIVSEIAKDYKTAVIPLALKLLEAVRKHTDMDLDAVSFLKQQAVPVILNECLVRAGYMFIRLYAEHRKGNIRSLKDLMDQIPESIAPKDNRTLLRMLTVSSGTFVAVTTAGALIRAAVASKGANWAAFVGAFAINVNYAGIGRFVLALRQDIDYIIEDIEELKKRMQQQAELYNMAAAKLSESFRCLSLNAEQSRILYSLEWQKTYYDISRTENKEDRANKRNWLDSWVYDIKETINAQPDYFIKDESKLYSLIEDQLRGTDKSWLLLVSLELRLFKPYAPSYLGNPEAEKEENKKYKGLKYKSSYGHDVFCIKQSVVGVKQYDDIAESLKGYVKKLNNNAPLVFAGAAAVVAIAALGGGAALLFAPEIATMLAGGAVAGLHGAALASASLAFVGGGALAVGGLGVAGGTAIIVGGGALVGAVVSGASVATIGLLSSKSDLLNECSKLLAYSDIVLLNYCHDVASVREIRTMLVNDITELEEDIASMKEKETDKVKKKVISNSEDNLKFIRKTIEKLDELLKDQPVKEETGQKYMYFSGCRTEEDVRRIYRGLMKLYAPDIYHDGGERARIINEERERILKDLKA